MYLAFFLSFVSIYLSQADDICQGARSQTLHDYVTSKTRVAHTRPQGRTRPSTLFLPGSAGLWLNC